MKIMKIKKIAELAFHESTSEPEAIAAFLALRRLKGGFTELKDELSASKEQVSSWVISGPDSYIGRAAYCGCMIARRTDGKCHVKMNEKKMFGKQRFTITLKYSSKYSSINIEKEFERLLKRCYA